MNISIGTRTRTTRKTHLFRANIGVVESVMPRKQLRGRVRTMAILNFLSGAQDQTRRPQRNTPHPRGIKHNNVPATLRRLHSTPSMILHVIATYQPRRGISRTRRKQVRHITTLTRIMINGGQAIILNSNAGSQILKRVNLSSGLTKTVTTANAAHRLFRRIMNTLPYTRI